MAQRKLTQKQLMELLTSIGVEDVEVVGDDAADNNINLQEIIQAIDGNRKPIISQQVLAEKEQELNKSISGKLHNAYRSALSKKLGVDPNMIAGKDAAEAIELAMAHFKSTLGDENKSSAEQLQKVMDAHAAELKKLQDSSKAEVTQLQEKLSSYAINRILAAKYGGVKNIPDNLDREVLQGDFINHLKNNFHIAISADEKDIELYDKNNPTQRVLNETMTQQMKVEDLMQKYHAPRGQWVTNAANINPAEKMKQPFEQPKNHIVKNDKGDLLSPIEQRVANMQAWASAPAQS